MRQRTWLWTPIALAALAVSSYVVYRWLTPRELPAGIIYGNGNVEGTDVVVASEVTGRVIQSALVEGRRVRAGEVLVRLDPTDLATRLRQLEAQTAAAAQDRDRSRLDLVTARHHLAIAQRDDFRYAALVRRGVVSEVQREQAANALSEARDRVATLQSTLTETSDRIEALTRSAQLAQSQLTKTTIVAPISGTILVKSIEVGELAAPGRPIATLVDLTQVKLKIYFPEKDIGKLRLGGQARVRTDAIPDRYFSARISRIDSEPQFTPRDIHMPDERVRLVFGVTLRLDNPQGVLNPGMPADAWIRWDPTTAWPVRLWVPST